MDCLPANLTVQDIITLVALTVASGAWLFAAVTLSRRRHYLGRAVRWLRHAPAGECEVLPAG